MPDGTFSSTVPYESGRYCLLGFYQLYGLPTACLRYFNVYEARQDQNSEYATVIPRFIKRAYEGNLSSFSVMVSKLGTLPSLKMLWR